MNSLVCLFFVSILSIGTEICSEIPPCNVNVLSSNLNFTLFTQQNQVTGVPLNVDTYSSVNSNYLTTLIIPGWRQSITRPWVLLMKDTYLNKTSPPSANIILIDWSAYSDNIDETQAACAVPYVGSIVGELICNLTQAGVDPAKLQINGFSLGAHVAGCAGQRVQELCNSYVNRINGLDATNPGFAGKPIDQRLDASDAVFVQAIHTNNNVNGFAGNYGTIDFHVNTILGVCGSLQPGCPGNPGVPNDGSPLPYAFCDHVRAIPLYTESITSDKFLGVTCSSCFAFALGSCNSYPKTIMGEMCPFDQSGVRYLKTASKAPFALG